MDEKIAFEAIKELVDVVEGLQNIVKIHNEELISLWSAVKALDKGE